MPLRRTTGRQAYRRLRRSRESVRLSGLMLGGAEGSGRITGEAPRVLERAESSGELKGLCPGCDRLLSAPADMEGKPCQCPRCNHWLMLGPEHRASVTPANGPWLHAESKEPEVIGRVSIKFVAVNDETGEVCDLADLKGPLKFTRVEINGKRQPDLEGPLS